MKLSSIAMFVLLVLGACAPSSADVDAAVAAYTGGDYERAVEQLRDALDSDPGSLDAHLWLGKCYLQLALREWELAVAMPEDELAIVRRRYGVQELSKNEEATRAFHELADRGPQPALVREKSIDAEYAEGHLLLIEEYPLSDVAVLCYYKMAQYYLKYGDSPTSLVMCNRLVDQYPNSEYADDALLFKAQLQYSDGLYADAVETLEVILRAYPESKVTVNMSSFAYVYYGVGQLTANQAYADIQYIRGRYLAPAD